MPTRCCLKSSWLFVCLFALRLASFSSSYTLLCFGCHAPQHRGAQGVRVATWATWGATSSFLSKEPVCISKQESVFLSVLLPIVQHTFYFEIVLEIVVVGTASCYQDREGGETNQARLQDHTTRGAVDICEGAHIFLWWHQRFCWSLVRVVDTRWQCGAAAAWSSILSMPTGARAAADTHTSHSQPTSRCSRSWTPCKLDQTKLESTVLPGVYRTTPGEVGEQTHNEWLKWNHAAVE